MTRWLLTFFLVTLLPSTALPCGSSCECPPGHQCVVQTGCKPAGAVAGAGVHPLCCTNLDCEKGTLCEHPDGSVGTCGTGGCVPKSCSSMELECGQAGDGCGGSISCGMCPDGDPCQSGQCVSSCIPNCLDKSCGDDGCGEDCGACPPGYGCDPWGDCVICVPDCSGKECGDNGCGGSCGVCPEGLACAPGGFCANCVPECENKDCGADGCGGTCGACGFDQVCNELQMCVCAPDCLNKECGDDGCGGDCGHCGVSYKCSYAGNCVPDETQIQPDITEQPQIDVVFSPDAKEVVTPKPDAGKQDSGSSNCPAGYKKLYGKCVLAEPIEDEEPSGSGGCSAAEPGSSWMMLALLFCLYAWRKQRSWSLLLPLILIPLVISCSGSTVVDMPDEGSVSDWYSQQPKDGTAAELSCVPDCQSKECGDNGCGGTCGVCPAGVNCAGYKCQGQCNDECPVNGQRQCSEDASGLTQCGQWDDDGCLEWSTPQLCAGGGMCINGACVCHEDCEFKQCGYDGCSGSCGTCPTGTVCSNFVCVEGCTDECSQGDAFCTGDGRVVCSQYDEDECLEWSEQLPCTGPCEDGVCECLGSCAGKQCGDDGCGKSCGSCPPGKVCEAGVCKLGGAECVPGDSEELACGLCGKQLRSCTSEGYWGDWSLCAGEGGCTPGDSQEQACGNCGIQTRVCTADCQWPQWAVCQSEGPCSPAQTELVDCGLCGTQSRYCTADCKWGQWAMCSGEGICSPGETQSQPCGACGAQTRSCNNSCQWGGWQGCVNQGACDPGAVQQCGGCGNQTCGNNCQWGPCNTQGECVPGAISTQGCPACQARTCTNNCTWAPNCNQCSGCQTFTQCGMSCPAGYHATNYGCSLNCGGSCWSDNQSTCAPSCGNQFTKCGMGCPSGYHATNYGCSLNCGGSCWSDNQTTCVAD